MKSKYVWIGIVILVIIVGIIFIKNPFKQEAGEREKEETKETEQFSSEEIGDPDATWTYEGLRLSGKIVDHEVFQLPDGSYYMYAKGTGAPVASSPDGLIWTAKSGENPIAGGASIIKISSEQYRVWWDDEGHFKTAVSRDGKNWENEVWCTSPAGLEEFYGALPFVVLSPDGIYRMYYAQGSSETHTWTTTKTLELLGVPLELKIPIHSTYSAHSSDGLDWELDPGIRIDGAEADNGLAASGDVYIREDGKYEMVYNSGMGDLAWAVSDDGLSWTRMGLINLKGFEPVINVFPDGTIRMYYTNWIDTTAALNSPEIISPEDLPNIVETIDGQPVGIYSAVREPIEK